MSSLHTALRGTDPVNGSTGGANQVRVRAYNERLVLSLVRRHGRLAKAEIARMTGLSAQTVTVITREMEREQLLLRGNPVRGGVGQPSIPLSLDPRGAFSIGLKVGRRSAEMVLVDFLGEIQRSIRHQYPYPSPDELLRFVEQDIVEICQPLEPEERARLAGIGVAMPFELWNWARQIGVSDADLQAWRNVDFVQEIARICDLPVYLENDATAACRAELTFGSSHDFSDYLYVYLGMFVGGGVVLGRSVLSGRGRTGNAGALGPLPITNADGGTSQLVDHVSVYELEKRLIDAGLDPRLLWESPDDWSMFATQIEDWIASAARHLAIAVVSAVAIIDFEAVIIDGALPRDVCEAFVAATDAEMDKLILHGLTRPQLVMGSVGADARALGGACLPLHARYLLDSNVLFKVVAGESAS